MFKQKLLAVVLVVCMVLGLGTAMAASVSQDGLKVELTTDRASYNAGDTIQAELTVTNGNPFAVENVCLTNLVPAGYTVQPQGSETMKVAQLNAGETATLKTSLFPQTPVLPTTGDNSQLLLWTALLLLSAAGGVWCIRHQKYARRLFSLLLCVTLVSGMCPAMSMKTAEASGNTATVKLDVTVGGAPLALMGTVEYTFATRVFTRGEWVQMLAEKVDMNLGADPANIDAYYADSLASEYGVAIETAQGYGVLPAPELEDLEQDIPFFYPDELATREFAAYTAVRAMGFTGQHNYDTSLWADWDQITNPHEAAIAVGQNMLSLDANRNFRPTALLGSGDVTSIFAAIDALNASTEITEVYDRSVYAQGVKRDELRDLVDYTVTKREDGTYLVVMQRNAQSLGFKQGDVLVLPVNDKYMSEWALKVRSTKDCTTHVELICEEPAPHEVFEKIDFSGMAMAPVPELATAAEGIELSYIPPVQTRGSNDWGGTLGTGKFEFSFPKDGYQLNNKLKASGKVTVSLPAITAKATVETGWFKFDVKSITLSLKEEVEISGQLEYTLTESGYTDSSGIKVDGGRHELGRIPIQTTIPGISVDIVFYIQYEAKGSLSITYKLEATQGFQVVNGAFRNLCSFGDDLEFLTLKGEAAFYGGVAVDLVLCGIWDLVGGKFIVGPAFNASITPHVLATDTMICIDATLYASMKAGLDEHTVVGELLKEYRHYTLEWELLGNDSDNPFKLKLHLENGSRVDECTFGTGVIKGKVKDSAAGTLLANARVKVYSVDDRGGKTLVRTDYTDSTGSFSVSNLTSGDYHVTVSATGYQTYTTNVNIYNSQDVYLEAMMMVERTGEQNGAVRFSVTDAVNGSAVSGSSYAVRSGWANTTSTPVKQGSMAGSSMTIDLPKGNYTLEVSRDGYVSNFVNIAVNGGQTGSYSVVLSPENSDADTRQVRIVLTWGAEPEDLDSHLFGIRSGGRVLHTYYYDKSHSESGKRIADLDLDDVTSYGPETTTIYVPEVCESFSFYVHDYTNRDSYASNEMSVSGASVALYMGNELIARYPVPEGFGGTVWHVFDYDVASGRPTQVNSFSYSANPETLRSVNSNSSVLSESRAIELIREASKEEK